MVKRRTPVVDEHLLEADLLDGGWVGQIIERELGSGDQELAAAGTWQTLPCVVAACEQPSVFDQLESIERREATALPFPSKRRRRTPEHR